MNLYQPLVAQPVILHPLRLEQYYLSNSFRIQHCLIFELKAFLWPERQKKFPEKDSFSLNL